MHRVAPWLLVAVTGCSFVIDGAPDRYRPTPASPPPRCTSSIAPPVIDAALAVGAGALAYMQVNDACMDGDDSISCNLAKGNVLALVAPAIVFGISSVVGIARVSGCREAIATHARVAERTER